MSERAWTEGELRAALDRYEAQLREAGKARNTIATYVQHPERFINWLVGQYQPAPAPRPASPGGTAERVSRYRPLQDWLARRRDATVALTFTEIEEILGAPLPASARKYRPWWANESAGTHVHAHAWLNAGRHTVDVDLDRETVSFALRAH